MNSVEVIRRHEQLALGRNDSELSRAVRRGALLRIGPGSYVRPSEWQALKPIERHRMRVLEHSRRLPSGTVYSHFAAAALWNIRLLGAWPDKIHTTVPAASGGRSEGAVVRHCTGVTGLAVAEVDGVRVTSPAQTVVDLARLLPFPDAVVALDSALAERWRTPLATSSAVADLVERGRGGRGMSRAIAAVGFSTSLSDSPEESHSRVQIYRLGFPRPELQHSFVLPSGRKADVDFWWEEFGHAGECDGRSKYRDPDVLRGRSPADTVIDEKNRENELRRVVGRLSRWEPAELYTPRKFYDRLTRDGLPSSRRRP